MVLVGKKKIEVKKVDEGKESRSLNKIHFYLFLEPQHFLYFFFDPHAQRSFGFCFFVLDLFASVVFLLSLSSVGASLVSPVEGSNVTNLLCSGLCSFQCAW